MPAAVDADRPAAAIVVTVLSVGPFAAPVMVVMLALIAAVVVGTLTARRRAPGKARQLVNLIVDVAVVGVVAARLGFVLLWWSRYWADPWSIIAIGDGGYLSWVGALAALFFACWRVRGKRQLWRPMGAALITGWAVWVMGGAVLTLSQQADLGMPDAQLARLDGGAVQLAQLGGQPMVVNLWATWCPPCRREMPMLEAAQRRHPDITFVFVNQRQGDAAIRNYLDDEKLQLDHVLVDSRGLIAQAIGSRALPTTLFYDAAGRLVDTHVGMLTSASLAATLQQFDLPATDSSGDDT